MLRADPSLPISEGLPLCGGEGRLEREGRQTRGELALRQREGGGGGGGGGGERSYVIKHTHPPVKLEPAMLNPT